MRLVRCHALAPAGLSRWDETWLRARCADATVLSECDRVFKPRTSSVPARLPCPGARACYLQMPCYAAAEQGPLSQLRAVWARTSHRCVILYIFHLCCQPQRCPCPTAGEREPYATYGLRFSFRLLLLALHLRPSTLTCDRGVSVSWHLARRKQRKPATTSQFRNSIALLKCEAG
jgi:hypothetical protein